MIKINTLMMKLNFKVLKRRVKKTIQRQEKSLSHARGTKLDVCQVFFFYRIRLFSSISAKIYSQISSSFILCSSTRWPLWYFDRRRHPDLKLSQFLRSPVDSRNREVWRLEWRNLLHETHAWICPNLFNRIEKVLWYGREWT